MKPSGAGNVFAGLTSTLDHNLLGTRLALIAMFQGFCLVPCHCVSGIIYKPFNRLQAFHDPVSHDSPPVSRLTQGLNELMPQIMEELGIKTSVSISYSENRFQFRLGYLRNLFRPVSVSPSKRGDGKYLALLQGRLCGAISCT